MALAARKTAAKKVVRKPSGAALASSGSAAVASAQKQIDAHLKKLILAKERVKQAKASVIAKKTKATQAALAKARANQSDVASALSALKGKVKAAKTQARVSSIVGRVKAVESRAKAAAEQKARSLLAKTDADFKIAIKKFEDGWRKKRLAANAKKIRVLEKRLAVKVKAVGKKSRVQAKALTKKAGKVVAKTKVAAVGESPVAAKAKAKSVRRPKVAKPM
ncbi:MAG: hypothetical protein ACSLE5_04555 [Porticoccaceae bacterium]